MLPSYTSLIKKLRIFRKALTVTILFTAILTNGGIKKGIRDTEEGIKKNDIYVL